MVDKWQKMPFSQAITINPKIPLIRGRMYPFVDMGTVDASFHCVRASEMRLFGGGGSRFYVGDTLMARITPCLENGKIARFCGERNEVAHGSTEFIVIRGREGISDTGYAYYLTKWEGVTEYAISQMTGTSGRQRVPIAALDHLLVTIPPLSEQCAIANILGTLDDKIELNRKMSETLETMVRVVFKAWFVDFEPVRAKMEGRWQRGQSLPGLPAQLYDAFPGGLINRNSIEIPDGWSAIPFADTIEIIGGGTPRTSVAEYWNGDIPWFSVVDAPLLSQVWVTNTEKKITLAGLKNSSTQILPKGTTIISARGTVGRIALVGIPMAMNQSCYGLRGKGDTKGFYTYLSTYMLIADLQQHTHGSVFDTITRDTLKSVATIHPTAFLISCFEDLVAPLFDRILANTFQIDTLSTLRDTLLPRLISGELRVKDAERMVAAVL